ncbi:MAG TPA: phosphoribosylanthranilate isomerase [Bacteroidota bacterium]|nr:phosphoribosylanthranilate isomerase [Bacteroidota bacterium]
MKVKICGITRLEDALAAADEGANAIGMIFAPSSARYVTAERARAIISELPPFVMPVGVFVNAPRAEILRTIEVARIQCAQLHGEESPADVTDFPVPVIKGFRVGEDFDVRALAPYKVSAYLLDSYSPGARGGTGKTFDWNVARSALPYGRIILSGGITPANVAEAVRAVHPYAIDLSSGVESSPGIKDRSKIRALFDEIRSVPV